MTDLAERLCDELDNLRPPDLAPAIAARLAAGDVGQTAVGGALRRRDRLRIALVAATVLLLAVPVAALLWNAFEPASQRRPTATEPTLGLRLFVDGRIQEISRGETRLVGEWPGPVAPYAPPLEGDFGIVGLAYGEEGVDLWLWPEGTDPERLATGVTHSFAVTSDGALAYGIVDQTMASTRLVEADLSDGSTDGTIAVPGYAAPVGFVGSLVAVTTGDGGAVDGGLWDGSRIVDLPENGTWATQPAGGYAAVRVGDGGCWDIVRVSDTRVVEDAAGEDCTFTPQAFAPSAAELAGVEGPVDDGRGQPSDNRVVVVDVGSRRPVFRSEPIIGVRQVAWEQDGRLLVLARGEPGTTSVLRCDVPAGGCGEVWTVETDADRYGVWLVPRAPSAGREGPSPVAEARITIEPSSGPIGTRVRLTGSCQAWQDQRETLLSGEVLDEGSSMTFGTVTVGWVEADAFDVRFSVPDRAGEIQATGGGPISAGDRIVFVTSPAGFCASEPFTVTD